jgi:hypothetical protein
MLTLKTCMPILKIARSPPTDAPTQVRDVDDDVHRLQ